MRQQSGSGVRATGDSRQAGPPAGRRESGRAELAVLARRLYVDGPLLVRKMAHYRIAICPFERLIRHVPPGSSVLDAGCGAGLFLGFLAGTVPGLSGVGFDASPAAIAAAARMAARVRQLGLDAKLRFLHLDGAEPWPEGLYDVVSLVDVLHHVPPGGQRAMIERAAEKVKPGGVLLYKDMAERPLPHAWLNRLHDLVVARQWIHYLPVARVDGWAAELGLLREQAEPLARLWYRHDFRIYRRPERP